MEALSKWMNVFISSDSNRINLRITNIKMYHRVLRRHDCTSTSTDKILKMLRYIQIKNIYDCKTKWQCCWDQFLKRFQYAFVYLEISIWPFLYHKCFDSREAVNMDLIKNVTKCVTFPGFIVGYDNFAETSHVPHLRSWESRYHASIFCLTSTVNIIPTWSS